MRLWPQLSREKLHPLQGLENGASLSSFYVPTGQSALVVRNGVAEQFFRPGSHVLPPGKVEVRLLNVNPAHLSALSPPSREALAIPFERSFLHVDGELLGVVKRESAHPVTAPTIRAWEDAPGPRKTAGSGEEPAACLFEPLRACHPGAEICCGARMGSNAVRKAS